MKSIQISEPIDRKKIQFSSCAEKLERTATLLFVRQSHLKHHVLPTVSSITTKLVTVTAIQIKPFSLKQNFYFYFPDSRLAMTEKAIEYLKKSGGDLVMRFRDHKAHVEGSLYEYFILRGIRVDELEPRFISCSFKVPPRLTDEDGRLHMGAIVSLVDEIGAAVIHQHGSPPMDVSVDMSISYISPANFNDELEIEGRLLGSCDSENGGLFGTSILIRNKVTGEVIAQGRHTLFRKSVPVSKM